MALALTLYGQVDVWLRPGVVPGPRVVGSIGLAAMTVPLGLRHRWPFAICCLSMAALAIESAAAGGAPEGGVILLPVLLVLYTVAALEELRAAVLGAAVTVVAVAIQTAHDPKLVGIGDMVLVDGFFVVGIGGAVWLVGRYVRHRRQHGEILETRALQLESERDRYAALIATERARIARELHDVIAHTVSVMGVQAAAAGQVLDRDPALARTSLNAIEETARDTVGELKRLLAVLRDDSESSGLTPQPDLTGLRDLLDRARGEGLSVELAVDGAASALPAGIELAAYRIIQEALTNVRKHAAATTVRIVLTYRAESLELSIDDDGEGQPAGLGTGRGIVGMRERAALYGGTLQAGPKPVRGYAVRACLPLGGEPR